MAKFEVEKYAFEDEPTSDGLGLVVHDKTLYHHSFLSVLGDRIYLTPQEKIAASYALSKFPKKEKNNSAIREVKLQNAKLLDLRRKENIKIILAGFKISLQEKLENSKLDWASETALQTTLQNLTSDKIKSNRLRALRPLLGRDFVEYCQSLGYDGLIALDGEEGIGIGHPETYLIFDQGKVRIT